MELGKYELAKNYVVYRYTRALVRKQNTTDESILGLIKNAGRVNGNDDENRGLVCVQRNLIAGEVSKDLTKRILLPEKITKAHEQLKSTVKNAIKNTDKAVAAGNKVLAEKNLKLAVKSLDNAKSKGLVHRNKVDREKSRLTKLVNSMEVK